MKNIHYLLHKCKKLEVVTKVFYFSVFPLFRQTYCIDITFVTILSVNSVETLINKQAVSQLGCVVAGTYLCACFLSICLCLYPCRQNAFTFGTLYFGMVEMQITIYRMLISNTDGLKFQTQQL